MPKRKKFVIGAAVILAIALSVVIALTVVAKPSFQEGKFMLKLPTVYTQLQSDGSWNIFGINSKTIGSWFGLPENMMMIRSEYLNWFAEAGIEYAQLKTTPDGLFLFVNHGEIPHLRWNKEGLQILGNLAEKLEVPYGPLIRRWLPYLTHIHLDLVIMMPGVSEPKIRTSDNLMMVSAEQEAANAAAEGEEGIEFDLDLPFDEEGYLVIFETPLSELGEVFGVDMSPYALPTTYLAAMHKAGVSMATIQVKADGFYVLADGIALLQIAWSQKHIDNAVDLYAILNQTGSTPNKSFVAGIRETVNKLNNSNVEIRIHFPGNGQ